MFLPRPDEDEVGTVLPGQTVAVATGLLTQLRFFSKRDVMHVRQRLRAETSNDGILPGSPWPLLSREGFFVAA